MDWHGSQSGGIPNTSKVSAGLIETSTSFFGVLGLMISIPRKRFVTVITIAPYSARFFPLNYFQTRLNAFPTCGDTVTRR